MCKSSTISQLPFQNSDPITFLWLKFGPLYFTKEDFVLGNEFNGKLFDLVWIRFSYFLFIIISLIWLG